MPSDEDIDYVAAQLGIRPPEPPQDGFLKRFGKGLIRSEITLGKATAGALAPYQKPFQQAQQAQQDFLGQTEQLRQAIISGRERGEDTSRLRGFAQRQLNSPKGLRIVREEEIIPEYDISGKRLAGAAAGTAIDALTYGAAGRIGSFFGPRAIGLSKGIIQGLKIGAATGALFGTTQSIVRAMQDDQDIGGIIAEGATGGTLGGTLGAITGGVTGGISGALHKRSLIKEALRLRAENPTAELPEGVKPRFLAKYELSPEGRLKRMRVGAKAVQAGLDPEHVQFIKESSEADKTLYREAYQIAKRVSGDMKVTERPVEVAGRTIIDKFKTLLGVRKNVGTEIGKVIDGLPKKPMDITPIYDDFVNDLRTINVATGIKNGRPIADFTASRYANQSGIQNKIQDALDNFIVDRSGKVFNTPQQIHVIRQRIFTDLGLGKLNKQFDDYAPIILDNLRSNLEEPLTRASGKYEQLALDYAKLSQVRKAFYQLMGPDFRRYIDITDDAANLRAGEIGFRMLGNAPGRVMRVLNALEKLTKEHGAVSKIDTKSQIIFANFLEDVFGTNAPRSLEGAMDRAFRSGQEAVDAGRAVAQGKYGRLLYQGYRLLRNRTPDTAQKALEQLLKVTGK